MRLCRCLHISELPDDDIGVKGRQWRVVGGCSRVGLVICTSPVGNSALLIGQSSAPTGFRKNSDKFRPHKPGKNNLVTPGPGRIGKASFRAASRINLERFRPNHSSALPPPRHLLTSGPMASRRLALNLSQGLRNRASLTKSAPLSRGFASPVASAFGKTQTTTLKNGLTVRAALYRGQWALELPSARASTDFFIDRSLPTTRHGHRPPPSACGLMPAPGPRPTRPTALLTSWSTLPSR